MESQHETIPFFCLNVCCVVHFESIKMKKYNITEEHKAETYRPRKLEANFDRVDYALSFMPGHLNKGAVVKTFVDAISNHDSIVKKVEEKWVQIDELKRDLTKKTRLFRNLDSLWTTMNSKPDEYSEFLEMMPRMKNIKERMKRMTNFKVKARAETELNRFNELLPLATKLMAVQKKLELARDIRDEARRVLTETETELGVLREVEKDLAAKISDDHVIADEKGLPLCEMFLNVHVGHILHAVNGHLMDNKSFEEVITFVAKARGPHRAEFKRYDFKYNPFLGVWKSLQELREEGECVEDPMLDVRCCCYWC